ncbi:MAG: GNAT family N-acetyltransferase [Dehalococcoidia bacterium]|nr:GNAT family N-acetyltransferase [Dehalococcoidia bacterium]
MKEAHQPPVLRTPRLVLRPFAPADLEALHTYRSDPEWGRYLPLPHPYTLAHARTDLAEYVSLDAATHPFWAIEHQGQVVGNIDAELEAMGRALIGWGIARPLWRRGLTSEAARAVVAWCFEAWPVRRVYATASARNVGSWRVMEQVGMRREALLRGHREERGVVADEVVYGILRDEWTPTDHRADRGEHVRDLGG